MKRCMVWYGMVIGGLVITLFTGFTNKALAGDATLTLDDNAGSSSFVVQDVDKVNQFKINSDGQGYFAGNVGIGTTGPESKLDVAGMLTSSKMGRFKGWFDTGASGSGRAAEIGVFTDGVAYLYNFERGPNTHGDIQLGDSSGGVYVKSGGNVGIATTTPTERLDVAGNIKASGTVSQGSSKEFKKNISYVSTKDAMNTLNKLNPVRFEYKTDNSGEKHLGFIAEDVPALVAEGDRKHLNAMDITAVLTRVVQEQQRMILELSEKIKTLENRL